MIDLHSHILPGLDDGAKNIDEALEMCRIAQADGIHTLVATPHCRDGVYNNNQATILPALENLRDALQREGVALTLLPGIDILIYPGLIDFLDRNPHLLLGGRYVLLELPIESVPLHTLDFLFKMQLKGYTPIITHPERNSVIQNEPAIVEELVRVGALVQVTAMSLTGEFGGQARESAHRLVRSGLAHSIATDAHSPHRRPPVLSHGRKVLEEIVGPVEALKMVEEIPEKILRGEPVEGRPLRETPPSRPSFFRRLFMR